MGSRSGQRKNRKTGILKYEDFLDNTSYDPELTLLNKSDDVYQVQFVEYGLDKTALRGIL
ncbi:MAG: hypothetical protein R2847_10130 [Bacteroidia bacterium]